MATRSNNQAGLSCAVSDLEQHLSPGKMIRVCEKCQVSEQSIIAKTDTHVIVEDPEVGTIYNGTVKRIMEFGAFVEILPGKEGLCHISKFSRKKIASVSDVVKEGQQIPVKLIEIDKMGRLNLSYIDAIEAQAK